MATYKTWFLDPAKDIVALAAKLKSVDQMKNLILGGAGNGASLLITLPQQDILNKGIASVNQNVAVLNSLASTNANADSVLTDVVKQARDTLGSTAKQKITAAVADNRPAIIQSNFCTDANIDQVAREDVQDDKGDFDETTRQARRNEIWSSLCDGDPSTDPGLAKRLNELEKQRPEAGGWGSFMYAVNKNPYTTTEAVQQIISEEQAKAQQDRKTELATNKGIANKTDCNKTFTTLSGRQLCEQGQASITALGSQLSDSLGRALNVNFDSVSKAIGDQSLITTVTQILSTAQGINDLANSFNTLKGGGGSKGSIPIEQIDGKTGNKTITNTAPVNTAVVTSQTTTFNSPAEKSSVTGDMLNTLKTHLDSLTPLETTDNQYIAEINNYASQLESLKGCSVAASFYNSKKDSLDTLRLDVSGEISTISNTRTLITTTQITITNSNSPEVVSGAMTSYLEEIARPNRPSAYAAAARAGELQAFKTAEAQDFATVPVGQVTQLRSQCQNNQNPQGGY
jgi:hypothetical protein